MNDPIANLEALINEMALSQGLIEPSPIQKLMYNEEYVRGVLGIDIPLNESYPYSLDLQQRILEEQLLFEGFFSDFKKLSGDGKNLALAMRYMMEDASRIKDFVTTAYETVIKEPLEKILGFIKKVIAGFKALFEKFALPKIQGTWDKVKDILQSFGEKLKATWEKIQGMSGWQQALVVMAFGTGIGYLWSEKGIGDIVEKADEILDDLGDLIESGAEKLADIMDKFKGEEAKEILLLKKESVMTQVPLSILLYDDSTLNEFWGKKKKDKEKTSASDKVEKAEGAADKAEKASKYAGKLSSEEYDLVAKVKEAIMEKVQPLIDVVKEKIVDAFKGMVKQLGAEALVSLASGGVGAFISGIKKAFGGFKLVSKLFGGTLEKFVNKIKDPEKEAEEAEKGEDDPTDDSTKKEEKKESVISDEVILREYIRERLLAS